MILGLVPSLAGNRGQTAILAEFNGLIAAVVPILGDAKAVADVQRTGILPITACCHSSYDFRCG
ncbi:MAG: hypothetical protein A2Y50_10880 [Pseudomonadales bacterium RIFCSPLOWO2_12_59_9]|nr:MAG: hypothetical protein A2Y50_10880 [Pseudomonadales bacterium RIFCSPLOWO2_12_59_9]